LTAAQAHFKGRLIAIGVVVVAAVFTLLISCVAVIAATWDTPHRMLAVYCMLGCFAGILVIALAGLSQGNSRGPALFASVKREWALDRVILDRILDGSRSKESGVHTHSGNGSTADFDGGTHTADEHHG
jgi:uncharacterized membrane protein YqjE